MSPLFYIYLVLQIAIVFTVALCFRKKMPLMLWLLTASVYITMPMGVLIKGIASALYLLDLLLPVMVVFSLSNNGRVAARMLNNKFFLLFRALLFLVPVSTGLLLLLIGHDILAYDGLKSNLIWFYRNMVLLFAFGIGIASRANNTQLKAFVEMNIVLGFFLALAGIINYFGPFNLAVFEMIVTDNDPFGYLANSRVGAGFLGLFRGSVGQWFAILGIMAAGSINYVSERIKIINILMVFLSVAIVLLSFSRAGMLGLVTGISIIVLFSKTNRLVKIAVILIFVSSVIYAATDTDIVNRFDFNRSADYTEDDSAIQSRLEGWKKSLYFISNDPVVFLFGVAPANESLVYEKIGLYGSHNEFLNVIIKIGIVGFIMFSIVIIALLKFVKNKYLASEHIHVKNIYLMVLSAIFANIVISMTQAHLLQGYSTYTCIAFIYIFYGVFIGAEPESGQQTRDENSLYIGY